MIGYNYGVVGGYVTTQEEQTIQAAHRIADILNGAPANSFPQITETDKKYVFDYKILDQWGISLDKLPAGSEIINIPFYIRYQLYIICLAILLGIVLMVIIIYQRILYKRETAHKRKYRKI